MGDDEVPTTGAPPKLTLGQRLLTALPRFGANAPARPSAPTANTAKTAKTDDTVEDGGGTDDDTKGTEGTEGTGEPVDKAVRTSTSASAARTPERAGTGTKAKGTTGPSGMSKEELAHRIKYVDDRERLIGLVLAPLATVLSAGVLAIGLHTAQHVAKGEASRVTIINFGIAGLVVSVLLFLAAWSRRRSFMAFALLFMGLPLQPLRFPIFVGYWFAAGWILFRSLKWQRELAAINRAEGGGSRTAGARGGGARSSTGRGGQRQDPRARAKEASAARAARRQPAPKGPPPSKRYTPPKPTRPRPPASPS
jgi:hypothetical protein